jgi:tetratricopeptide (TPR) repeat protein
MKRLIISLIILLFVISGSNIAQLASESNIKQAKQFEYPSLNTPGNLPIKFGEGIISLDSTRDRDIAINKDLDEIYFSRVINRQLKIHSMKKVNGVWTMPELASFTDEYSSAEPVFTTDGNSLFYISTRPLSGTGDADNYNIWYLDKVNDEWGEPKRLNELIDYYPTFTEDNKAYFTNTDDLYMAELKQGQFINRQKLSDNVNTSSAEYNSVIAPDESYLIFSSFGWGDGFGGGDLFICFKDENGDWSKPKNMGGGINSSSRDYCPALSPDGKYLFFASNRDNFDDIYWVDTKIIDILRNKDLNVADSLVFTITENRNIDIEKVYSDLKERYSKYCYFNETILDNVGNRLLALKKPKDAIKIFNSIDKIYPDDYNNYLKLKSAILEKDNRTYERLRQTYSRQPSLMDGRFEFNINTLGYRFLINQYIDEALKVFELYVFLLPNSSNAYDSYGEALLASGDTTQAIVNYKKS